MASWHRTALALFAPAAISIGLYLGALRGGFVWDDAVLVDGSGIGGGRSLAACFRSPFLDHFYRPLVSASFYVDRLLWPNNPWAYHWVNITLHALATIVVGLLVREAFASRALGAIGALVFAVHPVHVGAVAWIGGRTDALGCLWTGLFMLGLVSASHRVGHARAMWLVCSVVTYALSVFTKEQTLFLLPLVPLAFVCFEPRRGIALPGDRWYALLPFVVVAAFYLAIGVFLGMPGPQPMGVTVWEQLSRVGLATLAYAELLMVPNQRAMHALSLGPWERLGNWAVVAGYCVVLTLTWVLCRWYRRDRRLAWMLASTLLAVLPVSNILPMPFLLYAPYRAAVASIGLAAILASKLANLRWRLGGFRSAPAAAALACITTWCCMQTLMGIPTFESESALFGTVVRYDTDSVIARYMLAKIATDVGDHGTAAEQLSRILDYLYGSADWRDPETAVARLRTDRLVRMRAMQNQGTRGDPGSFVGTLFRHLGFALMNEGHTAEAIRAFRTALVWHPDQADIHHGLGWCYASQRSYALAEPHLVRAIQIAPTAERYQLLAQVYEREGRFAEATRMWREAARMGNADTTRL